MIESDFIPFLTKEEREVFGRAIDREIHDLYAKTMLLCAQHLRNAHPNHRFRVQHHEFDDTEYAAQAFSFTHHGGNPNVDFPQAIVAWTDTGNDCYDFVMFQRLFVPCKIPRSDIRRVVEHCYGFSDDFRDQKTSILKVRKWRRHDAYARMTPNYMYDPRICTLRRALNWELEPSL